LANSKPDVFSSNGISIGATKDPSIVSACNSFNLNQNLKTTQKDIGGEHFLYLQIIGGSKAGPESIETHYKTLKNGICYEIVESVYYTGVATLDTHDGFLKRAARLDSTIQSFRFTTPPASSTSANQKTYTDSQHGFSIQYPNSMSVETSGYNSLHPFTSNPVAYIGVRHDAEQTEGYLTINASDVGNCSVAGGVHNSDAWASSASLDNTSNVSINGTYFSVSTRSGFGLERDYTTTHNGTCYDIQVITFPSACISSGCSNPKWSLSTETALLNELDVVVQSFRFN